jgi:hypothetical protein
MFALVDLETVGRDEGSFPTYCSLLRVKGREDLFWNGNSSQSEEETYDSQRLSLPADRRRGRGGRRLISQRGKLPPFLTTDDDGTVEQRERGREEWRRDDETAS